MCLIFLEKSVALINDDGIQKLRALNSKMEFTLA
jgi:hypothetical protein